VVGVLGTAYTVGSEMFRQTTERYATGIGVRVIATAGNGLVEAVENGREDAPETERLLRGYIEPMLAEGVDELVLACTHFPLLIPAIRRVLGDRPVRIVNPAPAIARHTAELLRERGLLTDRTVSGRSRFTGSGTAAETERLRRRAERYRERPMDENIKH
ncbi:MAG: aspartate/glutamate racemase family protein, partial [Rikenella sp.]|nr:aspartate/glutamate racemase family protein [Rikenella sp.]